MMRIPLLLSLIFLLTACDDKTELPTVITKPVTEVTWEYAITGGEVISNGSSPVTERGCIYSHTDENPTFESDFYHFHTEDGSGVGEFTSKVNIVYAGAGHSIPTTNYIRAYATNKEGTAYGEIFTVYPKSIPPEFNSIELFDLTATSATFNCDIGINGYDEFYFCYSQDPNPGIEGDYGIAQPVNLQYMLTGLSPGTMYNVRGYVMNESGYAYSENISITTLDE